MHPVFLPRGHSVTTVPVTFVNAGNWREQLGSLGSGNHFIEVSVDELDRVWLFLHSGSRGVGNKIEMWNNQQLEPNVVPAQQVAAYTEKVMGPKKRES